ncbi:hypothetical protein G6514_005139 [Epicoccum nigrum]|nr:hypothetical protein G6514_005139 [Epicoccum nigrum]
MTEKASAGYDMDESKCCPVCNCLGYCAEQNSSDVTRPSLKVISPRTLSDFEASAKEDGCRYCDYAFQSFLLLGSESDNPTVELLCYPDSPTELHSATNEEGCDVVEIYPCTDSESSFPKVANDVSRENVPETALQFIEENYFHCRTVHSKCPEVGSKLPKRILDISTDQYRLVEPDEEEKAPYATLSYSWGGKRFFKTTIESYERLKCGFEKEELPIAFQEAALVARSLNIGFIWIDSLCIIQDDVDDWEEQAAQMGQIFEFAAITIAASLSSSPFDSLFTKRDTKYEGFELYDDLKSTDDNVVFKARRKTVFGIHAKTGRSKDVDPLDTRAWGLQEKLLSSRLIAFTGAEIQWTCQTSKVCECRRKSYIPQPLFLLSVREAETKDECGYAKAWSKIVEPYSNRDLTFIDDRLPALSGLAKKFWKVTNYTYIAGLWQESIWYDLLRRTSKSSNGYELHILEAIYQPNTDQRKTCEFSIDAHHTAEMRASTVERAANTLACACRRVDIQDQDTPVILLSIYSIHHRNYLYQNFLILKLFSHGTNTYERVGIGSGKIYDKIDIPAQSQSVQPFNWLSVDFGSKAGRVRTEADQAICLI